jgi:transposase
MDEKQLFGLALGLTAPWFIDRVEFDPANKRLDLFLGFGKGSKFACPECDGGDPCPVHDTKERTWRHLDFFQHQAYLTAKVPRVTCSQHGVHQVNVPWARPGSGFTLLFEALALCMAKEMAVAGTAKVMNCQQASLWRILAHYVTATVAQEDYTRVTKVGVDECSKRKGHNYITTFCDLQESRVVHVAEGRDSGTFSGFARFLGEHGVDRSQITDLCMDMWEAYLRGAREEFPGAAVTFDRYHVMVLMNKAIDEVRREETLEHPWSMRGSRYLWLRNPDNLGSRQREKLQVLKLIGRKTARAYQIKLALQELWKHEDRAEAEEYLARWYSWARRCRLEPVKSLAQTIKRHWDGVLHFITSQITTGIVEGLNSKIKTAMKRAYGFKSFVYLRTIIYLVAGKLNFPSPTQC